MITVVSVGCDSADISNGLACDDQRRVLMSSATTNNVDDEAKSSACVAASVSAEQSATAGASRGTVAFNPSTSQTHCDVSAMTRPSAMTLSTAFTVSLVDNDNTLQLHDNLGRFLPSTLQLSSRTVARRHDVTTDANDVTPDNNHGSYERRRVSANNINNNSSVTTTTCVYDDNHATTTDEQHNDVTDDVTSEAGTYTVDEGDEDDVRRARTYIDHAFNVTSSQPSGTNKYLPSVITTLHNHINQQA